MMIESRVRDQSGLGPQVKDVSGRISLVAFDLQAIHKIGVKAFLRVSLDIKYQSGELGD